MSLSPFYRLPLSILAAGFTCVLHAQAAEFTFDIPAQPLNRALLAYGRQSKQQLVYNTEITENIQSPALKGTYAKDPALIKLLAKSGLHYRVADNGTVLINKTAETSNPVPPSPTLPTINVVDKALYDDSDPYNEDYSLPNTSTATKTDTPIIETPFSVKTIPKQVLEDQQVIRLEKALQNVAGVVQESSSAQLRDSFTIRGFSTGNDILYYRNGNPVIQSGGNGFSSKRDTANLERIEVLKGPGSLLFGRVEPGGIINLVTKQPLETAYYSLQQLFGSFDFYRTTIDATGPVSKDGSVLYRVNAAYESANSFADFVNSDRVFVAPVLKWNISPRTQLTAELEYQRFDETPGATIPALGNRPINVPISRNIREPGFNSNKGDRLLVGFNWSHSFNDNWNVSHRFYYNNIDVAEINQTFFNGSADALGNISRGLGSERPKTDAYFTSLNLTGKLEGFGLKHTLLLGGDYFRSDATDPFDVRFPNETFNVFNPVYNTVDFNSIDAANRISFGVDNTTEWYGLYAQDQVELPHNLFALAGFRFDQADQFDNLQGTVSGDENRVSPRVGLLWRPLQALSWYGSYTENFGAANGNNGNGQILPAQTAQQWETGLKTELLDGRFSATAAYFELTRQNLAVADPNNILFLRAIGEAQSRGLELDISGELLPGWHIIGGYSHLFFANVTRDVGFDGGLGTQGNLLPNVPRDVGSLFTTYEFQQGVLQGIKVGGGVTALSQRQGNSNNTYQIPGYAIVNLLASYSIKVGKAKVTTQLNIENLLDKTYFAGSNTGSDIFYGAPRTFLGSVRVEY